MVHGNPPVEVVASNITNAEVLGTEVEAETSMVEVITPLGSIRHDKALHDLTRSIFKIGSVHGRRRCWWSIGNNRALVAVGVQEEVRMTL